MISQKILQTAARYKHKSSSALAGAAIALAFADQYRRQNDNKEQTKEKDIDELGDWLKTQQQQSPHAGFLSPNLVACEESRERRRNFFRLARSRTLRKLQDTSTKQDLNYKYDVAWDSPLGEGGFGAVYLGKDKITNEPVAVKKIPKAFTDDTSFQKEMNAFLHIRENGGHPNICGLKENFDEGPHFYLVLDLVSGGEMFDHLCSHGAYSEADAARLVREVGSALAFLHGVGCVHGDLKPENLMLSSEYSSNAVIKLVDFGCAQIIDERSPLCDHTENFMAAITPGYSPPEVLGEEAKKLNRLNPSMDMFSLGIIVYVMLTGLHPFDLSGTSSDEEINERVKSKVPPPLRDSPITEHLSPSSIDLIEKLISPNPKRRLTAQQMLDHPWVRGETARTGKMEDSDKRLSTYRAYKSRLEAQVFASMVEWSEDKQLSSVMTRTSLIERSFQMLDPERKGYITKKQLRSFDGDKGDGDSEDDESQLSLSGFSDLLSDNMKNRFFPAGHTVYREGDRGDKMYFINSGRIAISTKGGYRSTSESGDFFGEGALISKSGRRSSSVKCVTPVHAIEIKKEYFDKYCARGYDTKLTLAETANARKRNRAKTILSLQENLMEHVIQRGEDLYRKGQPGDDVFILEDGIVDVRVEDHTVFNVRPGELCGEFPLIFGRPRNTSAECTSDFCTLHILKAKDFHKLLKAHPSLKETLRNITLRREFQKALVLATKKPFPTHERELRAAFEAADYNKSGRLDLSDISLMLKNFDSNFTDSDIKEILGSLDLDQTGAIHWEEFKRIFGISA